jgi:hypothetical protein
MELPESWIPLGREEASRLEAELRRELPAAHRLRGLDLVAVARRRLHDDVLFRPAAGGDHLFCVHLTWSVETDPTWPMTVAYRDLDHFLERWPLEEEEEFHEFD